MLRGKFDYPDLDVLDSPLPSSILSTSAFFGVPGSAIAENIFNDPDSWEENDTDVEDLTPDPLAWLPEGIEKSNANNADVPEKRNTHLASPAGGKQLGSGLKGIHRACSIRPITIPYFSHDADIQDQLSKILDARGIPHHIRPLSSPLTPSSFSEIDYYYAPLRINTSTVAGSTVDGPSPLDVHSSSITMSFLEWYGIESDLNPHSLRPKSINPVPSPKHDIPSLLPSFRDPFSHLAEISIPPPGLESPPPHSVPRSRSHSFDPPPYARTGSPATQSRSRSLPDWCSHSQSCPTRRRRLPSIPLTDSTSSLPPLHSSPTELPELGSQQQLEQPASCSGRPSLSSVRSPPVGPARPRTRANNRAVSQDSIASLPHRPPMIRL